jgi:hypothetical protein
MTETTRQRLLEMAADAWMRGLATMPDRKVVELANIIDKLGDGPT